MYQHDSYKIMKVRFVSNFILLVFKNLIGHASNSYKFSKFQKTNLFNDLILTWKSDKLVTYWG